MRQIASFVLALGCVAGSAGAAALYDISVSSTFAAGGVAATLQPSGGSTTTIGDGVAFSTGVQTPSGMMPATRIIDIDGFAPYPTSYASSVYQSGHTITTDNSLGLAPLMVAFTFSYAWSVVLSADGPPGDFARGGAFFHITGIDNELLEIGGVVVPEFLLNPVYDTLLGGSGGMGGGLVTGAIIVPAGEFSVISVITDSSGEAFSIPEARTWSFVAGGLLLCFLRRRR